MNPKNSIALIGCPNSGKTALFNQLTGAHQKIGNYPGVTIEKKSGNITLGSGQEVEVIDCPGLYSLKPHSPDEEITIQLLNQSSENDFKAIIVVVDATNLEHHLGLILELKEKQYPLIICLNMMDQAKKRGLELDINELSDILKAPIIPTIATKKFGYQDLLDAIDHFLKQPSLQIEKSQSILSKPDITTENRALQIQQQRQSINQILKKITRAAKKRDVWTERLDSFFLHPVLGPVFLAAILITMFQSVFSLAEAPMNWVESGCEQLGLITEQVIPSGFFQDLIVQGIIAGVGSVLVFLPQILILYFFIILMEGSGYMMRATFLLDKLMGKIGLQGRSFVPLLSSYACAIPGIMACRTIRDPKDRLLTMLVAPLTTCSARLPVYVLLIGAFIPNTSILGPLSMQGLTMAALFLAGILAALIEAWILKKSYFKNKKTPFIQELPSYKWPHLSYLALQLWQRAKSFLKKAGTLIMLISIALWLLSTYPKAPSNWKEPDITYSFAGRVGKTLEPIFQPIGFDWRITTSLIPGFAAREVMVGALGTVFSVEDAEESGHQSLQEQIRASWPLATGVSLLIWYIFSPQCLATIAVIRKESNSIKVATFTFVSLLAMAYFFSWIAFQVFSSLGS